MNFIKDLKVLLKSYCVFLLVFLVHRAAFWIAFKDPNIDMSTMLHSWWIGFRFDLRMISIFHLVGLIVFVLLRLVLRPLKEKFPPAPKVFAQFQTVYLSMGLLVFTTVFWVDIGNYSYLEERLSSKMLALLSNPAIALGMVAQSYPIYILIPALIFVVWVFYALTSKLIFSGQKHQVFFAFDNHYTRKDGWKFFVFFFILAFCIHSKLSQYPLRWSEAYFSKSHFINQFALNPVQNVFDTYKFSKSNFTIETVRKDLDLVKKDLGISDSNNDLLVRKQKTNPVEELKGVKNVVVIMMESLAAFKLGAYGSPLATSPNFDKLATESLLFENFHVIQSGTAASIFCFITSTPDLNEEETASRNPLVVDQHTMINNFKDKQKFYFIGGDANWGNIRGIIKNNIEDVKLMEEKDFKTASKSDIWGISDLSLFNQAHEAFEKQDKPFFAFIQTAGYHRPYTIPRVTDGFESKTITEKQIGDYGFSGNDEYNALRFSDHALGKFFEKVKTSKYYKDTLFVVYADHGLRSYNQIQLSQFYKSHFFPIYHIPFLVHSPLLPKDLKGTRNDTLGYQPDILPTVQSMLGVSGVNSSFGLDLRSEEAKNRKGIFLRASGALPVRFFDGERVVTTGIEEGSEITSFKTQNFVEQLKAISKDTYLNQEEEINDEVLAKARLGRAYLKSIKYKLKNNQKAKVHKIEIEQLQTREQNPVSDDVAGSLKKDSKVL